MLTEIRRSLGFVLALMVVVVTLGRVSVNWTGGPTGAGDGADARQAVATEPAQAER